MTVYDLLNPDGTEVEEQRMISAPGATTGDVLTVNADDTISPAPGGGSQPVTLVSVPVSSAELLALGTKTLVATPGANKMICPLQIVSHYTHGAASYAVGTALQIAGGFNVTAVGLDSLGLSQNSDDGVCPWPIFGAFSNPELSVFFGSNTGFTFDAGAVNKPLELGLWDDPLTTGNGSLVITIAYYVADFS